MNDRRLKPAPAADAASDLRADEADALGRAWWARVPKVLTSPRQVFVALSDTDDLDVGARAEPILAITILAGTAGVLLTPAWGRLMNDPSVDGLVAAVVTFIAGIFYGAAGYFMLGLALWLGAKAVGVDAPFRIARQVLGFAALPVALSLVVLVPAIVLGFGSDWFRSGGGRRGHRAGRRRGDRARVRRLVARARRARAANDVPPAVARRRRRARDRRGDGGCVRRAPERAVAPVCDFSRTPRS